MFELRPADFAGCPYKIFTPAFFQSVTKNPWSKANSTRLTKKLLAPYKALWKRQASAYRRTPQYRENARQAKIVELAELSGLENDGYHGNSRGDWFTVDVMDYIWRKSDLRKYHASGRFLALVEQSRKRVYAKSSDWYPRTTDYKFVVGENENGNPFHHAVPNTIATLAGAIDWIWNGAKILHRHGDIGVAPSHLKHVEGEYDDIDVMGGHSRHRFIGEVHRNGSLHIRNGFLYHTADQHPPVYVDGSKWRRIVISRRSERIASSAD